MKKEISTILLIFFVTATLTACGRSNTQETDNPSSSEAGDIISMEQSKDIITLTEESHGVRKRTFGCEV